MRPWLQDLDGDGTYTWASVKIPQGNYEFKVAHGLGWDRSYPAGNVTLTVPADGMLVTINYALASHQVSVSVTQASATPGLTVARAVLVRDDLIAYPANAVPYGADPAVLLAAALLGQGRPRPGHRGRHRRQVVSLTRDLGACPPASGPAHPELADAIALRSTRRPPADETDHGRPGRDGGHVRRSGPAGGRHRAEEGRSRSALG